MNEYRFIWKDSPAQWYLILFLIFWVFFFLILNIIMGVGAISTHTSEIIGSSGGAIQQGGYSGSDLSARGPNNIIYHLWFDNSSNLKMDYSDDNGSSWDSEDVVDVGYDSCIDIYALGFQILSNNTTVVLFWASHPSSQYSLNLAFRWAWSGSWEYVQIIKSAVNYNGDMAIDHQDLVAIVGTQSTGTISNALYDPNTRSMIKNWGTHSTYGYAVKGLNVVTNSTGVFWLNFVVNDGSMNRVYWYDFNKTLSAKYSASLSNLVSWYPIGSVVTPDDYYFMGVYGWYSGVGYNYIYLCKMTPSFTITSMQLLAGNNPLITYTTGSITTNTYGQISMMFYDQTNDNCYRYQGMYFDDYTTFINSMTLIYAPPSGSDQVFGWSGISSLFPQVNNVPVNMPLLGYAFCWLWYNELGASDLILEQIHLNATWNYISYAPMIITNTTLEQGYVSQPYIHRMYVLNGNLPFTWEISFIGDPNDGWLLVDYLYYDATGQYMYFYGFCPNAAGNYQVLVTVEDFYGNIATATLTLSIEDFPTDGGHTDEAWSWGVPSVNFNGALWVLFIFSAFFVATYRIWSAWTYKEMHK